MFPNGDGGFIWRRCWRTRTFNQAFDGNQHQANPPVQTYPIRPGLTLRELRHSHKTWLIAAGIPEIAQARRLGHVADEVEARIQKALKQAWLDARHTIADHSIPPPVTPRHGWIRRHLPNDTSSNPAVMVTGSPVQVPQPTTPTWANMADENQIEDQIWSTAPQNHPIFDQTQT